jgi:hypothetical protein
MPPAAVAAAARPLALAEVAAEPEATPRRAVLAERPVRTAEPSAASSEALEHQRVLVEQAAET